MSEQPRGNDPVASESTAVEDFDEFEEEWSFRLLVALAGDGLDGAPTSPTALVDRAVTVFTLLSRQWLIEGERRHAEFVQWIWMPVCVALDLIGPCANHDAALASLRPTLELCGSEPDATLLLLGIVSCASSMRALATGDCEFALAELTSAWAYYGAIEGAKRQRAFAEHDGVARAFSTIGRMGAAAMHAASPYAEARRFVRGCWDAWIAEPERYASLASFARDMQSKFPDVIANPVTVERWARLWRQDGLE